MSLPSLVTPAGTPIPLDRQLAAGGEGAVYTLRNDPTRLAKVYHQPRSKQEIQKLMATLGLASPKLVKVAAWPTELACDARNFAVVGFLMNRMNDCQPIQHLYNPVQRLKCFPQAGWNFQVHAAANLAAAFDEVHAAGCLVGDVNQGNALVSTHKDTQAMVKLIDCDSFQVRAGGNQYPCEVGVVHFTPPELQGKPFRGLIRTENHDRFGLAVLIYQLLFAGRHPYQGLHSDDASFEQLISKFRFAQGPLARSWGMEPPPHTPTFDDIPPEIGVLFRRSFERGSDVNARPQSKEWLAALGQLGKQIATCKVDAGHKYWSGAKSCVWCRLAQRGGPEYYFGVAGGASTFAVEEAKLQEILRRLAAVQSVEYPWDDSLHTSLSRPSATPLPPELAKLKADWKSAEAGFQQLMRDRQAAEEREVQRAEAAEKQRVERIEGEFREHDGVLEDEYVTEREVARDESHGRGTNTWALAAAIGFGLALLPLGFLHKAFAIIGIITALSFGTWLGVYTAMSPLAAVKRQMARIRRARERIRWDADEEIREAKAETKRAVYAAQTRTQQTRLHHERSVKELESAYRRRLHEESAIRRRRNDEAEAAMQSLERNWVEQGAQYRRKYQEAAASIHALVTDCRGLARLCFVNR